jgi:hypothetical protein
VLEYAQEKLAQSETQAAMSSDNWFSLSATIRIPRLNDRSAVSRGGVSQISDN